MRQLFTIVAALVCVFAMAQKKPNINKAKAAYDKGEIAEAKAIIDDAIEYEKTKEKPKTWYYRGMIYVTIDTSTNDPEAMRIAKESFAKALELDPTQKSLNEIVGTGIQNVDSRMQNYYGFYFNKAISHYNAEEFSEATGNFEKAYFIMEDTTSILYAAYSATESGDEERANENYKKCIEAGITDMGVYLRLYNYLIVRKELDEAYALLGDALKVHPGNVDLMKYQINILIEQDKIDEAKSGIEEAIAQEPDNADLHFSLGVIYEEQENMAEARASYDRAIKAVPDHYNANFNLGVMVFNECNELIKERNALSYKEEKRIKELDVAIDEKLEDALPYWEKLYTIRNKEESVLETLKYIYTNLKIMDKAEKIADELDAVKAGG